MKHVGKMKNNGAKVVITYRTLPGDPYSALVVGTQALMDSYHDSLMSLVESDIGQQADELADVMAVRRFPDGSNMLHYLHTHGHLKKVPTDGVLITPDNKSTLPLNELNRIIAENRGIKLVDLAVKDGANTVVPTLDTGTEDSTEQAEIPAQDIAFDLTPTEMRSRADALFKEAAKLRKSADELDPPKSKKVVKTTKEATTET